MRISIDKLQTILITVGEEDSIGFEDDHLVQQAIETLQQKIQHKLDTGELHLTDILISFE